MTAPCWVSRSASPISTWLLHCLSKEVADLYLAIHAEADESGEETDDDVYVNGWTLLFAVLSLFGITVVVFA
jgi:hypothetical protein